MSREMSNYTKEQIIEAIRQYGNQYQASKALGIPKSTFYDMCNRMLIGEDIEEDALLVEEYEKVYRRNQRNCDKFRVVNKVMRESARKENAYEDLTVAIKRLLEERRGHYFSKIDENQIKIMPTNRKVGIIQLSDLHFGELVNETLNNKFDLDVASKRLEKLVSKATRQFKAEGITSIVLALTGDLINSSRRLSEITSYADARVKVVFNAYLILGELIEDLAKSFKITVAQAVGNESRLGEFFNSTNFLVSDNFDLMLYNMLKRTHERELIKFVDATNPMECVIGINGVNILLIHGNGHKTLANTKNIDSEVEKIKARYANQGVIIHYVICGHIHSTFISNNFSRSSSLVGSTAYSERELNFASKASQNIYIVYEDGSIDATMIDLQQYKGYEGYQYDRENVSYHSEKQSGNIIIQEVLV